ncbi:MAG: LPS export ABC transporter permease LptG [Xanthomonadaceae bacterium]|nr:LPS export ABC transporter permease LptG [Xanthomonadaceae bacterium]
MRILARYISVAFIGNVAIALLALGSIQVLQSILGQLVEAVHTIPQILYHHSLQIPEMMIQMLPPSVMLGTILTLSGFNRTNELVAIYSIGVGLRQVMSIIVAIVLIMCCFSLIVQDRVLPILFKKKTIYYWKEMRGRKDFSFDISHNKVWYRSKNLIYNLKTFDPQTQKIKGMSVYQFDDDFHLQHVLEAKEAIYTDRGWKLFAGSETTFKNHKDFPVTVKFAEKELVIRETPQDFEQIEKEVDALRLKELYSYIAKIKDSGVDSKTYEVKYHSKISMSLIPLVMCILAVPFSTRQRRQGGAGRDLAIGFVVTFFYWLLYSIGLSLGSNGAVPPLLAAWLPSILFMGLAGYLLWRD